MKTMKTTLSAIAILAIAGPALAADFTTLDVNADGQVSFDEYKTVALTDGKTVTLAAQEFTRMAQGDAVLTEDEFFLASAVASEPYALQPALVSEPLAVEMAPMEFEETFETSPDAPEMIEPPVVIEDTPEPTEMPETEDMKEVPAPIIMEKSMDVDPVVAGEVETSSEVETDGVGENLLEDVTPIEEIETDLTDPSLELDLDPDSLDGEVEPEDETDIEALESEDIESKEIY